MVVGVRAERCSSGLVCATISGALAKEKVIHLSAEMESWERHDDVLWS